MSEKKHAGKVKAILIENKNCDLQEAEMDLENSSKDDVISR